MFKSVTATVKASVKGSDILKFGSFNYPLDIRVLGDQREWIKNEVKYHAEIALGHDVEDRRASCRERV